MCRDIIIHSILKKAILYNQLKEQFKKKSERNKDNTEGAKRKNFTCQSAKAYVHKDFRVNKTNIRSFIPFWFLLVLVKVLQCDAMNHITKMVFKKQVIALTAKRKVFKFQSFICHVLQSYQGPDISWILLRTNMSFDQQFIIREQIIKSFPAQELSPYATKSKPNLRLWKRFINLKLVQ